MPLSCSSIRSIARQVFPVLVGPSSATRREVDFMTAALADTTKALTLGSDLTPDDSPLLAVLPGRSDEASSVHVWGSCAAVTELGVFEKAKPTLYLTASIGAPDGNAVLEQLNSLMTKRSLGQLVLPHAAGRLGHHRQLAGGDFVSRLGDSSKVAIRGVESTWVLWVKQWRGAGARWADFRRAGSFARRRRAQRR